MDREYDYLFFIQEKFTDVFRGALEPRGIRLMRIAGCCLVHHEGSFHGERIFV